MARSAKAFLGALLPLCLLALLLHAHAEPEAGPGSRLHAPDTACPACAVLQGGAGAPEPEVRLPAAPEPVLLSAGPASGAEVSRATAPPLPRGPPAQA